MKRDNKKFIIFSLIVLNILAWVAVYDLNQSQLLEVIFFDVGQGDAIFVKTPDNYQILIDGGPGNAVIEKLAGEMPFWDRTIDMVVLTHPEYDHMAGLIEVLKRYEVDYIVWTGVLADTGEYEKWKEVIKDEEAEIIIAQAGQSIKIGEVQFDILYPFENLEGQEIKTTNNTSIVSRLTFKDNSFLFTGDISKSKEKEILEQGIVINSDIIKVGHHGSKTSSSQEFIEAVSPEIAVIQCAKDNNYGHPHSEVLAVLENYDIKILRTDQDGDIKIVSNGSNFQLKIKN